MGCNSSQPSGDQPKAKAASKPAAAAKPTKDKSAPSAPAVEEAPMEKPCWEDGSLKDRKIELIYFNIRMARGELLRLMLNVKGVDFTDTRVTFSEWPEMKEKMPMGTLPVLTVDGCHLVQSEALARFVANELGLQGKTIEDAAMIDDIVAYLGDAILKFAPCIIASVKDDKEAYAAGLEKSREEATPMVERINKFLTNSSGFVVGDSITWGDYAVFLYAEAIVRIWGAEDLAKYDKLNALYEKVKATPEVANYMATRPETVF